MRVLWVSAWACRLGGAESYIHATAAGLHRHGWEQVLMYDVRSRVDPDYIRPFDAGAWPAVDLVRQVREVAPDIIYLHRVESLQWMRQLLASGLPSVGFVHDYRMFCLREHKYTAIGHRTCVRPIGPWCYPCLGFINRSDGRIPIQFRFPAALRRAHRAWKQLDMVVTGSQWMAEHVMAHGFRADRVMAIPLYVDAPDETTGVSRESELVVFAGQLVRGKAVDTLLRALAAVRSPWRLVICGAGRIEPYYRQVAEQLGVMPRCSFAGGVSRSELHALFRRAAVVVMPSRTPETFGLSGMEALSVGAPLIATGIGGVPEWLHDGETGWLTPPDDVPALTAAIEDALTHSEKALRFGQAGQREVRDQYTQDAHVKRLMSLMHSLSSDHHRR